MAELDVGIDQVDRHAFVVVVGLGIHRTMDAVEDLALVVGLVDGWVAAPEVGCGMAVLDTD